MLVSSGARLLKIQSLPLPLVNGYIPAIPQNECVCGCWQTAVFFFVRVEFTGRVKALLRSELLPRLGQRRAFTPAVILFIALPKPEDKSDPG